LIPLLPLLPRRIFRVARGFQFGFGRCGHRVGFSLGCGGGLLVGLGLRDRGALGGALFGDRGFARFLRGLALGNRRLVELGRVGQFLERLGARLLRKRAAILEIRVLISGHRR